MEEGMEKYFAEEAILGTVDQFINTYEKAMDITLPDDIKPAIVKQAGDVINKTDDSLDLLTAFVVSWCIATIEVACMHIHNKRPEDFKNGTD